MLPWEQTDDRPRSTGSVDRRVLIAKPLASMNIMAVQISNTPNPNALKFTVDGDVGGPATFVAGSDINDPTVAALIAIDGITSVFMTADFVTLSKTPDTSWDVIAPLATTLLEQRFGT